MLWNSGTWLLPVDVKETQEGYTIMLELPGSHRDDIKIWQENGLLTISGEKKAPSGDRIHGERVYGKFERCFRLPKDANVDKIEANYRDGVVTVEIEKLAEAKPKAIKIN